MHKNRPMDNTLKTNLIDTGVLDWAGGGRPARGSVGPFLGKGFCSSIIIQGARGLSKGVG
jgi:hypothetical protein